MKTFLKILGWLLQTIPLIYSLVTHNWILLIGIILASFGVAISLATGKLSTNPQNIK